MSSEYRKGRADGRREAVEIIRQLEETVARKLEQESPWQTRKAREVRRQAFRTAATRVTTVLKRVDKDHTSLKAAIGKLGL
jgi:GTP1/Obg family GTP-binding protein